MRKLLGALFIAGLLTAAPAQADTFTLEPFDFDQVVPWWNPTITAEQFGGSLCPCEKVPYPATALPADNQKGADNLWALIQDGTIRPGSTVAGFSLGVQVISLAMSQHVFPCGVDVVLAGDTLARNQELGTAGIPINTCTKVVMVANQYDGNSDWPSDPLAPGYWAAVINAALGSQQVHNYVNAQPGDPANVVMTQDNITAVLIPNQNLPLPNGDRTEIDGAYARPSPTQQQLDAATDEQVPGPMPPISQGPEPAAG